MVASDDGRDVFLDGLFTPLNLGVLQIELNLFKRVEPPITRLFMSCCFYIGVTFFVRKDICCGKEVAWSIHVY